MSHQGPVLETVQEANQLLKQRGDKLSEDDSTSLRYIADTLKARYETVNVQSNTRLSALRFASDDLGKLEPEVGTLEEWLRMAEQV